MPDQYGLSSVYVPIAENLAESVLLFSEETVSESDLFIDTEKTFYGREDEPHITVAYGLPDNNLNELTTTIRQYKSFKVSLGLIDVFKRFHFDVVIIRAHSKELYELHHMIMKQQNGIHLHRFYEPHLTLAYVQKDRCQNLIGLNDFENITIEVNQLVFSNRQSVKTTLAMGNKT